MFSLSILSDHLLQKYVGVRILMTLNLMAMKTIFVMMTTNGSNKLAPIAGENENLVFVKFFKLHRCYDLIPISAKLIVFDTQLLVKKAFHALVSNGVRAAPLWNSSTQSFVGMLTITDFINILRTYYKSPDVKIEELEEQNLEKWITVLSENSVRSLSSIGPDASLFDAIKTLIHDKVHRLPVIDPETGNVLYIMTHKRILKFLFLYYNELPLPRYLDRPIRELQGLGTYQKIATTTMDAPLIEAMHQFVERRVSALPVVDHKGKVIDIYAKFDVINLAAEKTYYNLDMTVRKALEYRNEYFEGVVKCTQNDTLRQVMERVVKGEVHRIVVVNESDEVIGMISLSDLLSFFALKPISLERGTSLNDTVGVGNVLVEESEDGASEDATSEDEVEEEDPDPQEPHIEPIKAWLIIRSCQLNYYYYD